MALNTIKGTKKICEKIIYNHLKIQIFILKKILLIFFIHWKPTYSLFLKFFPNRIFNPIEIQGIVDI